MPLGTEMPALRQPTSSLRHGPAAWGLWQCTAGTALGYLTSLMALERPLQVMLSILDVRDLQLLAA